ncbi:broad-complex core protein isoform X1 [Scaptodrosophila lebanonensis]|uniref:Broad-complex core protein isoform X1 n=1 Tax=Drosophila lebanonensis TaxID=7225 RepID=A0A6J2T8G3_DROLE|nr:broad-complex core protein isoform X1 [Scaptodrosophila lebanonensis]
MDDEFKLCWKNFQDNIASGFQNLYDRGDLVDVTLACDGKLLHAHKIVLAICSPYFQEIFTTNPCQHPIIILKDVSYNIMCELLEFMYQGVVNVKHTELQSFMKIGQLLQIKGLATNSTSSPGSSSSEKSTSQAHGAGDDEPHLNSSSHNNNNNSTSSSNNNNSGVVSKTESDHNEPQTSSKAGPPSNLRSSTASPGAGVGGNYSKGASDHQMYTVSKRPTEFGNDSLSIYPRKHRRRSLSDHAGSGGGAGPESNENTDAAMDALNSEEFFLPPIPHISMVESRYDIGGLKRESDHHGSSASSSSASSSAAAAAVASLRNSFPPAFNLDYNFYKPGNTGGAGGGSNNNNNNGNAGVGIGSNPGQEYPNELYMPNDYSKNFGNHMDIPPNGSNMVMLSTTSLLHGNCVFNRNNTVATQQGMKTYWLCKSYRISMCRARCITHLGRIISATGVHNHTPHMRGNSAAGVTAGGGGGSNASSTVTPNPNPNQTGALTYGGATDVGMSNAHLVPSTSGPNVDMNHTPSSGSGLSGACTRLVPSGNMFATQTPPPTAPPPQPSTQAPHHYHAHHHHHSHLAQSLPNLLVQQHGVDLMSSPNQMHLPMQHQQHPHHQQQQQSQHSPHPAHHPQQQHHMELGGGNPALLPVSPVSHMQQSPQSNRSSHSLHGATESPGVGMKSPPPLPPQSGSHIEGEQHVLDHNADLSPADLNSNTAGSAEAAPQAQVIDSITISPGNGHNFKIENM